MEKVKDALLKEPQGGIGYWFLLVAGSILTATVLVAFSASVLQGNPNMELIYGVAGPIVIALLGVAELVPRDRRQIAVVLRICVPVLAIPTATLFIILLVTS